MDLKSQLRESYGAGRSRYEHNVGKRPFWDKLVFWLVVLGGSRATEIWLSHHSAMATGWRFLIAISVACLLAVLSSIVLDKLRTIY
ncbi:MAG: hypothetical protein WCC85_15515 [Candidatus Sulfotelmatobacter sp.]